MRLVDKMFGTLYDSDNGLALAAPQIGVQKQVFVWDFGDDPMVVFNPEIVESDGEWVYEEGCLSIPGLYVEIVRPKQVLLRGIDVDGNPVEWEADELEARMFQHELDHLNGVLMFDRMTPEQRREAMAEYRRLQEAPGAAPPRRAAACACADRRRRAPGLPRHAGDGRAAAAGARRRRPRRRARRHPRRPAAGPGERDVAEPGEGGGARARPARHPRHRRRCSATGAELGVVVAYGRIIKPHVLAAAADGQRALLAAAAVARRGAGRAGAARRRRRDRRLHHGRRGEARHRAACTPAARCRSAPTTTAAELRAELVERRHRAARRRPRRRRCRTPEPQVGEVDVRREDRRPTSCELDWARPADRARPLGARRRGVDDVPRPAAEGPRRRRSSRDAGEPGELGADGATVGTGAGSLRLLDRAAGGQGADVVGRLRQRRPPRRRRERLGE